MEELIELLQQIQDLAGIAIDALTEAAGGGGAPEEGAPEEGGPMEEPPVEEEPVEAP